MNGNGIMAEIRNHLSSGKSSGQVIALGFKPPTVYKVQRALKRKSQGNGRVAAPEGVQPPAVTADNQLRSGLEAENIQLRQQVEDLEGELECVVDTDAELEAKVLSLREQVKALQAEAAVAGQLRQRVKELEGQLEQANHTQAAMRQGAMQWQQRVEAERTTRQRSDAQIATLSQDNQRLQGELAQWQQWGANAQAVIQSLTAEVEGLRPLVVWTGHPCKVCKLPMYGSVEPDVAAKLMQDIGHKACVEKQGSGLAWLLAGGAALYGLSQLSKK